MKETIDIAYQKNSELEIVHPLQKFSNEFVAVSSDKSATEKWSRLRGSECCVRKHQLLQPAMEAWTMDGY
jgi:hypothetical protein